MHVHWTITMCRKQGWGFYACCLPFSQHLCKADFFLIVFNCFKAINVFYHFLNPFLRFMSFRELFVPKILEVLASGCM